MEIEFRNDFHNTATTVNVAYLPWVLTPGEVKRIRRDLCGVSDCVCGGILGERGRQDVEIRATSARNYQGYFVSGHGIGARLTEKEPDPCGTAGSTT
jgi:hypothetical protein